MLRKLCVIDFGGLQGGSKGGSGGQKFFFGSKCLKLPNSSRKVVRLRSKNFQCICLINTYEIFENQFQKLIFQKWNTRTFYLFKMCEILDLIIKKFSELKNFQWKIVNMVSKIRAHAAVSQVSDGSFSNPIPIFQSSDQGNFA